MTGYDPFKFQAKLTEIVDGDTQYFNLDLGFSTVIHDEKVRLLGVDTHEIHFVSDDSEEYKKGMEEKEFVMEWFQKGRDNHDGDWPFIVDTKEEDNEGKYGRYLADVIRKCDDASLVEDLLDEFDGIEYED